MRRKQRRRSRRRLNQRKTSSLRRRSRLQFRIKFNLKKLGKVRRADLLFFASAIFFSSALYALFHVPNFKNPAYVQSGISLPLPPAGIEKPKPSGFLPPAGSREQPKLVFVIDDIGHTLEHKDLLKDLSNRVTYAILPHLPYSRDFANLSRKTKADVILHLPLETVDGTIPGPGLITHKMSDAEIREILDRNLGSVPHHVGVNNHMGSRGTTDERIMETVLEELKRRRLFFLDSFTTARSLGTEMGLKVGVPVVKRDIFLDNHDTEQHIRREIRKLAVKARQQGYAIGIGHYRYNTLKVLKEKIPELLQEGFQIVPLSRVVNSQSGKRKISSSPSS